MSISYRAGALALALVACGKSTKNSSDAPLAKVTPPKPADAAPATPTTDAAAKSVDAAPAVKPLGVSVKVGGVALPLISAIALPDANDLKIQLSTWPLTCAELAGSQRIPEGGRHLDLTIRKKLRPDGSWSWAQFGTYFEGRSIEGGHGEPLVNATIDLTPGARSRFDLDRQVEAMGDSPPMEIRGTVEVEICPPRVESSAQPPLPPQPDAFIEVAGLEAPIVGAAYLPGKKQGFHVMVSTSEVKCIEGSSGIDTRTFLSSSWPDVELKLEFAKVHDKKGHNPWSAMLDGEWIPRWSSGDGSGLTISPKQPKGKTEVTLTLGGSTTIADFPVAWSGTVKAIVCP